MQNAMRFVMLLSVLVFVSGCLSHKSIFLDPGPAVDAETHDFEISDPEDKIVIIFNQGTRNSNSYPGCNPEKSTPRVFKTLAGQRISEKQVYMYFLCTKAMGDSYIHGRADEIEEKLNQFLMKGVPAQHIFLAGQSAGAWSSIVTARHAPEKFNAIIGTAPAFSGKKAQRGSKWWGFRRAEEKRISRMQSLNALIFAFKDDAYNEIEDLEFLSRIPGVEFVPLPWHMIDNVHCKSCKKYAHSTAYRPCFMTQEQRIKNFIEDRLSPDLLTYIYEGTETH